MFEARLLQGAILKKIMDSIKDLVENANFDCNSTGISLQAMDSSHVSLVTLFLREDGFQQYRADRNMSLGINLTSLGKILKCAGNDDIITVNAQDGGDTINFMFESPKQTRLSQFSLKLMDIDSEHLGIPDTEYKCIVKMPSVEFQRIVKEIAIVGDTVRITASKEGVKFGVVGDIGNGSITCHQSSSVDDDDEAISVKLEEEIDLTFALHYLNSFAKATPLCPFVTLKFSPDVPLVVEYKITNSAKGEEEEPTDMGHLRFFLAPKIDDEGEEDASAAAPKEVAGADETGTAEEE